MMLADLLERLERGPFETTIMIHGPNVAVARNAQILSADAIGIVARLKRAFNGYGAKVAYPWSAVSAINLE